MNHHDELTKQDNINKRVTYWPYPNCPIDKQEYGVITSYNDKYIFVRYGNEQYSKATSSSQLTLD